MVLVQLLIPVLEGPASRLIPASSRGTLDGHAGHKISGNMNYFGLSLRLQIENSTSTATDQHSRISIAATHTQCPHAFGPYATDVTQAYAMVPFWKHSPILLTLQSQEASQPRVTQTIWQKKLMLQVNGIVHYVKRAQHDIKTTETIL